MTRDLAALAVIALWLVLILLSHYASDRSARREAWRSLMAGLCGLSVAARRGRRDA
jgi:multisubunit Na+/H+ antiporter MnhB subunit